MTLHDIALVQTSFEKVAPIAETASLFYGRLFEIAPEVKPVFKGNIRELWTLEQGLGDDFTPDTVRHQYL